MLAREHLLRTLMGLSRQATGRSRPDILSATIEAALRLTEADGASIVLVTGRQVERAWRADGGAPGAETRPRGPGDERLLLDSDLPRTLPDLRESRHRVAYACPGIEAGPVLMVPVRVREAEQGHLAVHRRAGAPRFHSRDARSLVLLCAWLAAALDGARLAGDLEKLAVTDDLTQVYNYRYLKTALRREIKRAGRFRQQLGILMVDVDNLKGYNDRNGHIRGSFLLKEIAQLFARQVRSWDLVAKYGGDEFTVILPQTGREGTAVVGERLRAAVEAQAFPLAERGQITVSLGVAVFPEDGDSATTLIEASDRALYQAKRRGRNRVEGGEAQAA